MKVLRESVLTNESTFKDLCNSTQMFLKAQLNTYILYSSRVNESTILMIWVLFHLLLHTIGIRQLSLKCMPWASVS